MRPISLTSSGLLKSGSRLCISRKTSCDIKAASKPKLAAVPIPGSKPVAPEPAAKAAPCLSPLPILTPASIRAAAKPIAGSFLRRALPIARVSLLLTIFVNTSNGTFFNFGLAVGTGVCCGAPENEVVVPGVPYVFGVGVFGATGVRVGVTAFTADPTPLATVRPAVIAPDVILAALRAACISARLSAMLFVMSPISFSYFAKNGSR